MATALIRHRVFVVSGLMLVTILGSVLQAQSAEATTTMEQSAANWAQSQTGSTSYQSQCLRFVYQACISAGMTRANLDANSGYVATLNSYPIDQWNYWMSGHLPVGHLHQGADASPPVGAIVYFSNKLGHDYSHATINVGGGLQISPDPSSVSGPQAVTSNIYRTMLGWWLGGSGSGGGGQPNPLPASPSEEGVAAVSSYTDSSGTQHVYSGTVSGSLYESWFRPGLVNTWQIVQQLV